MCFYTTVLRAQNLTIWTESKHAQLVGYLFTKLSSTSIKMVLTCPISQLLFGIHETIYYCSHNMCMFRQIFPLSLLVILTTWHVSKLVFKPVYQSCVNIFLVKANLTKWLTLSWTVFDKWTANYLASSWPAKV